MVAKTNCECWLLYFANLGSLTVQCLFKWQNALEHVKQRCISTEGCTRDAAREEDCRKGSAKDLETFNSETDRVRRRVIIGIVHSSEVCRSAVCQPVASCYIPRLPAMHAPLSNQWSN